MYTVCFGSDRDRISRASRPTQSTDLLNEGTTRPWASHHHHRVNQQVAQPEGRTRGQTDSSRGGKTGMGMAVDWYADSHSKMRVFRKLLHSYRFLRRK